ncbi:hypothetical protein ACI79C_24165 [Geodermatophilus sp. SYSU D00697]
MSSRVTGNNPMIGRADDRADDGPVDRVRAGAGPAGRGAALLALASAAVHLTGVSAASLSSLAMAGMALACLPCAWHLWRSPSSAVWATTVGLDLGMLAVHAPAASGGGGHVHGAADLPAVGLWLVGASLVLGLAVLLAPAVRAADRRLPSPADREETPRP